MGSKIIPFNLINVIDVKHIEVRRRYFELLLLKNLIRKYTPKMNITLKILDVKRPLPTQKTISLVERKTKVSNPTYGPKNFDEILSHKIKNTIVIIGPK